MRPAQLQDSRQTARLQTLSSLLPGCEALGWFIRPVCASVCHEVGMILSFPYKTFEN